MISLMLLNLNTENKNLLEIQKQLSIKFFFPFNYNDFIPSKIKGFEF